MAYSRIGKGNQGLLYYQRRAKVSIEQASRCLGITTKSYTYLLHHPFSIRLHQFILLAGLFDCDIYELLYCVIRNKERANDSEKWYIGERLDKGLNSQLSIEELKSLGK